MNIIVNNVVTPCYAKQCCNMLLTTLFMGRSTTLLKPVFINREQVECFYAYSLLKVHARLYSQFFNISDIDECSSGNHKCDPNATCTNTEGSYQCQCNSGYTGNGYNCAGI